jgi:hypothetical protein
MKSKAGQRAALFLLIAYSVDLIVKLIDWSDFARLPLGGLVLALTFRLAFMGFLLYLYVWLRRPRSESATNDLRGSQLRFLHIVHTVSLTAVVLYIVLAERLAKPVSRLPSSFAFSIGVVASLFALVAFGFRMKMLASAIEAIRRNPEDAQALARWRQAHILTMVLLLSVALFGFTLRFMGGSFWVALPFYFVSVALLLLWRPREVLAKSDAGASDSFGS